ncbi:tail fiber domain-containing protein [Candidatus Nomurabacteria bacterium]|nr:tail fiber domain-containing protein [Candidatus Nomurabacteria bacterium]
MGIGTDEPNASLDVFGGINFTNLFTIAGNAGTADQVLTSRGTMLAPQWATPVVAIGLGKNGIYSPGIGAGSGADYNVFLGDSAGTGASLTSASVFLGRNTGQNAAGASQSNFIGDDTGKGAHHAYLSNFFGVDAGFDATYATRSIFIGLQAGAEAGANSQYDGNVSSKYFDSVFLGYQAGKGATGAATSNFIGPQAGKGASNANSSNFIGSLAGNGASNANYSNFIGGNAGDGASGAYISNFFGLNAGRMAVSASNSIFVGREAGFADTVNNSATNTIDSCDIDDCYSILLGPVTSTGGFSNSVALGAYATNTDTNQLMLGSSTRRIEEIVFNGGSGNTCTIVSGTGISCSSDKRLKTNIEDLGEDTLEKVLNLRTVSYNWKSDPNGDLMVGFIAQNLQTEFPELVSTNHDGMLAVNYAQMTPIIVQAIREMNLNIIDLSNLGRENTWRDAITAWLGDISNGINRIFAREVQTEKLCFDDVCMTKDDLRVLLESVRTTGGNQSEDNEFVGSEEDELQQEVSEEVLEQPQVTGAPSDDVESTEEERALESIPEEGILETPVEAPIEPSEKPSMSEVQ